MNDAIQIIIAIIILGGVFLSSRYLVAWRIKRSAVWVLRDLYRKAAFDEDSAVDLPYAKKEWLKIGLRDFRPKAVESLFTSGLLFQNESGRFFLRDKEAIRQYLERSGCPNP